MAKPVSVQLYSVREACKADFFGTLKKIAAMGYAGVEYAGLHNKPAAEVAKVVKDLGMKSSSAHAGIPNKDTIGRIVDEAGALGYTRVIGGFGSKDMETEDAVKACAAKFQAGVELGKAHGLSVGMHNHWWEFDRKFNGKTPYEIIMSAAPGLFSELDIYWSTKGGADSCAVVRQWARRIPILHVKDGDLEPDNMHKAVGDGKVPIRAIVEAADASVLDWLVVELDNCKTDMFEAVARSVKWLVSQGLGKGR
jgi:sugar phosphate isomerase/epimerase